MQTTEKLTLQNSAKQKDCASSFFPFPAVTSTIHQSGPKPIVFEAEELVKFHTENWSNLAQILVFGQYLCNNYQAGKQILTKKFVFVRDT